MRESKYSKRRLFSAVLRTFTWRKKSGCDIGFQDKFSSDVKQDLPKYKDSPRNDEQKTSVGKVYLSAVVSLVISFPYFYFGYILQEEKRTTLS